jgi:hypothetical protein
MDTETTYGDGLSRKSQQEIVSSVQGWQTKIRASRSSIENQWNLNLAFYRGKQNLKQIRQLSGVAAFDTPRTPHWRSNAVFNHIRPLMRTELSKLTSQKPSIVVIPSSQDAADLAAAEAAEAVYEGIYQAKKLDRVIRRGTWWSVITGTGFIKTLWDPDVVDTLSDQRGDIVVTPETPYHVFVPDFRAELLEDQPYLIHTQYRNFEQVRASFPDFNGKPDAKKVDDPLSAVWLGLSGADEKGTDVVTLNEAWIQPGADKRFPQGAMITIAGDTLIQIIEGWPYSHGQYPFAKISGIPNGTFYHDSTIVDLIPVQKEYNRTRNQIIDAKNRTSKPQLMAPLGTIDPSKITTEPGQVILYKPGLGPPTPLPLQSLPPYVLEEVERLYRDFEDLSGQHEISKGSPPSGVTAATAISFLSEQDDAKLVPQVRELETAVETMGHQILSLVVQFWETGRIVKTVGQDNSFNSLVFKGSDLKDHTDIRVEAGSALSNSKAARQAFIMDLMKMQFIPVEIGLELLEMGNVGSLYERVKLDERQAQRENMKMSIIPEEQLVQYTDNRAGWETLGGVDPETGEELIPPEPPVKINDFDDHGKHIDTHNRFRKSQAYENLSPVHRAFIDSHVQAHVQSLMMQMPETMAGSTQPAPDSPTDAMASGNSAYAGPEDDSVTGSQQPPVA